MTLKSKEWLFKRKFGCSSLGFCFAEILVIWGVVDLFQMMLGTNHIHTVTRVAIAIWLFAGPASFALAVAGMVADSYRLTALLALIVSIVAFMFCGLRMVV